MSDEDLRRKKEMDAELACVDALLAEQEEDTGLLCAECAGSIVKRIIHQCRDCGMMATTRGEKNER